tara:strand:+ start:35 stop:766 length:732 start_codon:yes stop_codon:yes gene_type:complete
MKFLVFHKTKTNLMPRFYVPNIQNEKLELSEPDSKHAIRVLRLKESDNITIMDGKGILAEGVIIDDNVKKTKVKVNKADFYDPPLKLILAFSPTKNNDRNEWIVEKGTELGMTDCYPIFTHHSERRKWNTDRMQKIAVSAMKQSGNPWLPKLHKAQTFDDFINTVPFKGVKMMAHCGKEQKIRLSDLANPQKNQLMLIGPEGDFSIEEIGKARQHNFQFVDLGGLTLRTETACITSLSVMKLG